MTYDGPYGLRCTLGPARRIVVTVAREGGRQRSDAGLPGCDRLGCHVTIRRYRCTQQWGSSFETMSTFIVSIAFCFFFTLTEKYAFNVDLSAEAARQKWSL